jgi:DNA (cytosine-5)-methyltransferase 1
MITHGSLFSGIGGFDLGFSKAGIETLWQVEIDPFCLQVLQKNFPNTKRFTDVRTVGKHNLERVDVMSGGFPCQDISQAGTKGKQEGLAGSRSGLWFEYARIINELQPKFSVIENVPRLLKDGIKQVLINLAEIGYDAEWTCIRASRMGAPHHRERIFIVAYPNSTGLPYFFSSEGLHEVETPRLWKSFRTTDRKVWLESECGLLGHDDGLSKRLDQRRLGAAGNAIVPQLAELIGKRIVEIFHSKGFNANLSKS